MFRKFEQCNEHLSTPLTERLDADAMVVTAAATGARYSDDSHTEPAILQHTRSFLVLEPEDNLIFNWPKLLEPFQNCFDYIFLMCAFIIRDLQLR